jgi:hypothetical protein
MQAPFYATGLCIMQRCHPPLALSQSSPQKISYLFFMLQQKLPALQHARGVEYLDFLHPFMIELNDHPMTGGKP